MINGKSILAQGHMDGACFFYSIANAVTALTGKKITHTLWKRGVSSLPFKLEDFLAGSGTDKFDNDPNLLLALCTSFLSSIGKGLTASLTYCKDDSNLAVSSNQVIIAAIDNGKHWVVIIDSNEKDAFLACSTQALFCKKIYEEKKSPQLGRTYNRERKLSKLKIWNGPNLLIKCKS